MKTAALACASLLALSSPLVAGELKGRVISGDRPVAGVTVSAVPYEAPREEARRLAKGGVAPERVASATTKADGTFVLEVGAPVAAAKTGTGAKGARMASGAGSSAETLAVLELSGGGVAPVRVLDVFSAAESDDVGDVAVARGEPLAGRVVDAAGNPVGDAEVTLTARGDDDLAPVPVTTKTGADGGFRFDAAGPGSSLVVRKAGLASAALARVSPGVLARPIVLEAGVALAGVVRKPDGKSAAAGALVRFEGAAPSRWVETGDDGSFRLADLPRGKGRLVADGGDAGTREMPVTLPAAPDAPLAVVLRPAAALAGRVVDAKTTRPIPRTKLTLQAPAGALVARSKPDGTYAFRPLAGGAYTLKADEPRHVPWSAENVIVASGADKKLDVPLTPGATLSGKVVDESGQPIAGARGSLSRARSSGLDALLRAARGEEPSSFRSNADGTFRATRLSPGNDQRLSFRHPEHELAQLGGISLAPGGAKAGVTVVMKRGGVIAGRVTDAKDQPVAGADVELSAPVGMRRGRGAMVAIAGGPGGRRGSVKTGADGGFEIKGVPAGDHALSVAKPGFATAHVEVVKVKEGAPTPPVVVRLAKGASIRGFVRRPDGSGAEGYVVTSGLGRGGFGLRGGRPPEPTGPDGAFALDGLTDGESYDLQVLSGTGLGPQKRGVTAPADGVVIDVAGAGKIRGRALEAASGRPLSDFTVTYEADAAPGAGRMIRFVSRGIGGSLAGAGTPQEVHSEDGSFTIDDVPAGTWSVLFSASGYQQARVGSVTVEEGKTRDGVDGRLARGTHLTGRVTDAQTGQAVPGAAISHQLVGAAPMRGMPGLDPEGAITTDADGRYDIGELAPGKYQVTARHPDYTEASASVDVTDHAATADLQLTGGGALGGVVLNETRQPAAGVEVDLAAAGGGGGFGRMMFGGGTSTITDPSGRFRFEHLSPSRYTATASVRGKTSTPVDTVLNAGESRDDLVLTLDAGTTIHGTVSGLPSSQVSGVMVSASGPDSFLSSARTGSDGRFEITGAPPGAVTLRATAGDLTRTRTALKQISIGEQDFDVEAEVVFEDGLRISGTVTKRGAPAAGATVFAQQQGGGGRSASAQADDGGRYQLDGLHEGTYSVVASLAQVGGGVKRQTVNLTDDRNLDLQIPSATITGTVVEAGSKAPLDGATINVDSGDEGGGGGMFRAMTTDSNGRFTLSDLDEKSYTLTFRRPGFQFEKRTANASESGAEDLTVELQRGEGIGIQVVDGIFGVPLRGVLARVTDAQRTPVFTGPVALDEQGRGEIPSLRPGRYAVFLDASGYAPATIPALDVPQPTVRIAVTPGGTLEVHAGPETLGKGSASCQILGADGQPVAFSLFSADGRFTLVTPVRRLENLANGSYYLVAGTAGPKPFAIAEGKVTVLALP